MSISFENQGFKKTLTIEEKKNNRRINELTLRKNIRKNKLRKKRKYTKINYELPNIKSQINMLISKLKSNNQEYIYNSINLMNSYILQHDSDYILDILEKHGIFPILYKYINSGVIKIQNIILTFLINITAQTDKYLEMLFKFGFIKCIINFMNSIDESLVLNSIWCLSNVAGELQHEITSELIKMNINEELLKIFSKLDNIGDDILYESLILLECLLNSKPLAKEKVIIPFFQHFTYLIFNTDENILKRTCNCLSILTNASDLYIKIILTCHNIVKKILLLLNHKNIEICHVNLMIISNIIASQDSSFFKKLCKEHDNVIDKISQTWVKHQKEDKEDKILKEYLFLFSNMVMEIGMKSFSKYQINFFVKCLTNNKLKIKKEATWLIGNCFHSCENIKQIWYFIKIGVIKNLCEILNINDYDIMIRCIYSLKKLLEISRQFDTKMYECVIISIEKNGGLDKLEQLQEHQNNTIYENVLYILENFFEIEK
jgi:hypothetical protein